MADPMKHMEDYLYDLMEASSEDGLNEAFGTYLHTVQELYTGMMAYYLPGTDGKYRPVGREGLENLRERCRDVFTATGEYRDQVKAGGKESPAQTDRLGLMDRFSDLIMKDFNVFSGTLDMEEKSLPEILAQSRGYEVDLTGKELGSAGANLSSRIPLSFTDSTGKKISGFFTENSYANIETDWKKLRDDTVADCQDPVYARAIDGFMAHPSFQELMKGRSRSLKGILSAAYDELPEVGPNVERMIAEGAEKRGDGKGIQEYVSGLDISQRLLLGAALHEMCRGVARVQNKYAIFDRAAQISRGSNLNQRNSAMSTVADLLGVPDLVARSVRMKVVKDGRVKEGVFMEQAPGSDFNHLKPGDPMLNLDEEGLSAPGALKCLADLQVLDYICGNVDRHMGNMFYQVGRGENGMELKSVKGIDNDCSFGRVGAVTTTAPMRMVGTSHMRVISESMANKVQSLSPEMLSAALKDYPLSNKELKAAGDRLKQVQSEISHGRDFFKNCRNPVPFSGVLCVIKDDQWNQLSLKSICSVEKGENGSEVAKNYFAQLPRVAKDLNRKRELGNGMAGFSPRFAEGQLLTEMEPAAVSAHNQELDRLGKRLAEVNHGFFISSREFNDMRDAYAETHRLAEHAGADMTPEQKEALKASYEKLYARTQTYLEKKEKEERNMGRDKKPSETMKNRMAFARELKQFTEERIHGLDAEKELGKQPERGQSALKKESGQAEKHPSVQKISLDDLIKENRPEEKKSRGSLRESRGAAKSRDSRSMEKGGK